MRRAWYVPLLLAILFIAPSVSTAQEQVATPRLENLLPDHTFLYASLNDVSSMKAQFSRTALAKLWREEEVQQFLAPLLRMLDHEIEKVERKLGHPIRGLMNSLKGQAAIAVVEFDPRYAGAMPDAVITVDLGADTADFKRIHAEALASVKERLSVEVHEHGGVSYEVMAVQGMQLSIAYLGNALTVTTQPERLVAMIDAWKGGLPTALAKSKTFQSALAHVGGRNAFGSFFLNVESIVSHFGDMIDPQVAHILEVTGLSGIRAVSMGSTFVSEGIRDSFFIYAPGEKKGIMKLPYSTPGKGTGLLDHVPASAFYASAGAADWDKIMEVVLETIGDVEPMVLDQVMGGIYQAEEFLGLRIREDILKPMGDEIALYAKMPDGGGIIPDIILLCRMEDPARFEESMAQILSRVRMMIEDDRRLSMEHRKMTFMGKTIHYVHVEHKWGDPFPLTPSFMFDGDLFSMALLPQPLKDMVARGKNVPSIKSRPDFARALKGLPDGMVSLEYLDFQAGVRIMYGSLVPIAKAAAKHRDVPVDWAYLPRTETVAKHMFGGVWGAKLVDDGLEVHGYTPCGIAPVMIGIMLPVMYLGMARAGMAPVIGTTEARPVPERADPRPMPKRVPGAPKAKLEEIYIALLYHYAERDAYPADLGALVATKALGSASALVLPGDSNPTPTSGGAKTSFAYTGAKVGEIIEGADQVVWVYSQDRLGGQSRWVLFADGSIRQVSQEQFGKLLAATMKRIGK